MMGNNRVLLLIVLVNDEKLRFGQIFLEGFP